MSKIVVIDNEFITLECYPEKGLITHIIHKPLAGQKMREAMEAGTECFIKYGVYKWFSDDRKNGAINTKDVDWAFNDWNPRTVGAGWKYWGLVVPVDVASAGSLTRSIVSLNELGLRVKVSCDPNEAMNWLDSF